jgi:hypothetical protein
MAQVSFAPGTAVAINVFLRPRPRVLRSPEAMRSSSTRVRCSGSRVHLPGELGQGRAAVAEEQEVAEDEAAVLHGDGGRHGLWRRRGLRRGLHDREAALAAGTLGAGLLLEGLPGLEDRARAGFLAADFLGQREEFGVGGLVAPALDVREALPQAEGRTAAARVCGRRGRKRVLRVSLGELVGSDLGERSLGISPAVPAVARRV